MTEASDPGTKTRPMHPQVRSLQRRYKVDQRSLTAFMVSVAEELGAVDIAATVVLVGDDRMRALNRVFRGYDRATDVLSFPAGRIQFPEADPYLGDIVISVETAGRQARRRGSTLHREIRVLALHGFLHLLGYDHETDDGEMRRIEYRLRHKLGITTPKPGKKRSGTARKRAKKK